MNLNLYKKLEWLPTPPSDFNDTLLELSQDKSSIEFDLRALANYSLDINQCFRLAKVIKKTQKDKNNLSSLVSFNLGIVSNSTAFMLSPVLVSTAARYGVSLRVYEAPYGQVMQTALSDISAFDGVSLDAILVAIDSNGLPANKEPYLFGENTSVIGQSIDYLDSIRIHLREKYNAPCIMQTCPHQSESLFGSLDSQVVNSSRQFINLLNSLLTDKISRTEDFIVDVATISEIVGLSNWHDHVLYNLTKFPFSYDFLPIYSEYVCRVISSMLGKSRRALILDLDNTLWGGVIGDDGLNGIVIGNGDAIGEAYLSVQKTALQLHDRGIVLAVCSKNEDDIARIPFRNHKDMLLKEKDIAVFCANWKDKATNILSISKKLNLGLESIVFLDDNPVERDFVRKSIPKVAVPELPDDPSYYARTLLAAGYFETTHFSDDDKGRAESYKLNMKRTLLKEKAVNLDHYLESLNMKASMMPFDNEGVKRIVQLISKSNQFNLTTRRHNERDVFDFLDSNRFFTLQVRLTDIFGDSGMVGVIICIKECDEWYVDTWVMSCRVLGRRLENSIFSVLVSKAKSENISRIIGDYIPTDRNKIVKYLYRDLGFKKEKQCDSYSSRWFFDVNSMKGMTKHQIEVN
ncbi:HAD-IIIC family phosphatase [Candidatus Woesearchaeota archaeon]|jgi:FkbH-like protein|nr:HAD-IIIC family phosphatase [Candidatus Woesearchaeota archaeon]